ncbi:MAG TPA: hypothetical protein VI636_04530 [Candidatus Angelobacter sp.]
MSPISLVAVFLVCGLIAAGFFQWLCRFSERSPSDVLPFLQKIDLEALQGTFDPEAEEMLRRQLRPAEFKGVQWKRFHLAIHYCNMLTANSRILQGWTRYERRQSWSSIAPAKQNKVVELRNTCMRCRLAAFVIRVRLRWWLLRMTLLPFMSPPSFKTLLRLGSPEMISFYDEVRTTAEAFSLAYGADYHQQLMQSL